MEEIREHVIKLKNEVDHFERGHESVVEDFFIKLGYQKITEIKFQKGRVDVLISSNGESLITVEVKKSWDLDINRGQEAIKQAYNYAHKNDSRYVMITNGDYYAIFDRDKGRTYEKNFVGEFQLTNLTKVNLPFIETLRKGKLTV